MTKQCERAGCENEAKKRFCSGTCALAASRDARAAKIVATFVDADAEDKGERIVFNKLAPGKQVRTGEELLDSIAAVNERAWARGAVAGYTRTEIQAPSDWRRPKADRDAKESWTKKPRP